VDTGIGATLREARTRRKIDLSEVEAAIKIRVRYLQAIENEEWDALPGGAYTRGFIRTYAHHLGLDGERLAEDYRRSAPPGGGDRVPKRVEPVPASARRGGPRVSGGVLAVAVCLALVAIVIAIGVLGGDGGSSTPSPAAKGRQKPGQQGPGSRPAVEPVVAMRLTATAEVWACVLDASGKPLVDGQILGEGEEAGPFRSDGFELALGNGSVTMLVDGKPAEVEESSSPVGYAIDSSGRVTALEEGERPDCE
jgi:cytoskeleton protein RodZ